MKHFILLTGALIFMLPQVLLADDRGSFFNVETYPEKISKKCRDGIAKVYDECSDQNMILEKAVKRANQTGKSVLLVYGAEWCIWCHVFDKHISGQSGKFDYQWEEDGKNQQWKMLEKSNSKAQQQAKELNEFVAKNFVVAHIEGYYAPNGAKVIDKIGFDSNKIKFMPYIFSLNPTGKYASYMLASDAIPGLELRKDSGEEYRGYNRVILLAQLKKLREQAK